MRECAAQPLRNVAAKHAKRLCLARDAFVVGQGGKFHRLGEDLPGERVGPMEIGQQQARL